MLLALALFYFIRGRIRTQAPESGVKILRFNTLERFTHWMTATAFIVLGITGPELRLRQAAADAADRAGRIFDLVAYGRNCAHDFVSWAFMLGILMHAGRLDLGQSARPLRRDTG